MTETAGLPNTEAVTTLIALEDIVRITIITLACCMAVVSVGCEAGRDPVAPQALFMKQLEGTTGASQPHFRFLPPLAMNSANPGQFDPTLAPAIRICEWGASGCIRTIAEFDSFGKGGGRVRVDAEDEHYIVTWDTRSSGVVPGRLYQLGVSVGDLELGQVIVQVVAPGSRVKQHPATPTVQQNAAIPIRFRIEVGAMFADEPHLSMLSRELLTTSDPHSVYVALQEEIRRLYTVNGADEARRKITRVQAFVYDPVGDWRTLRDVHKALSEGTASPSPHQAGGSSASSLTSRPTLPQSGSAALTTPEGTGTSIIYVNGVLNTPQMAAVSRLELERVANELGWDVDGPGSGYRMIEFYNASIIGDPYQIVACAITIAQRVASGALLKALLEVFGPSCLFADFFESAEQMANLIWGIGDAADDAIRLAMLVQGEIDQGHRVLVVAHSQGNLMVQQALERIAVEDWSCIGLISLAAPTSAFEADLEFGATIVAGKKAQDIIRYLGLNFVPTTETPLALSEDVKIDSSPLLLYPVQVVLSGFTLHGAENYFAAPPTRTYIRTTLQEHDNRLAMRCLGCVPSAAPTPALMDICRAVIDANGRVLPHFTAAVTASSIGRLLRESVRALYGSDPGGAAQALRKAEGLLEGSPATPGDPVDVGSVRLVIEAARQITP